MELRNISLAVVQEVISTPASIVLEDDKKIYQSLLLMG